MNYKINWDWISKHCIYHKNLEEFKDKVNWDIIIRTYNLPEEILEKYQKYISWGDIARYQKVSDYFIIKHWDKFRYTNFYYKQYQFLFSIKLLFFKNFY